MSDRRFPVPGLLKEVLGESQNVPSLLLILFVTVAAGGALLATAAPALSSVAVWRAAAAALLIIDIAAGSAANFTQGTDSFYRSRPRHRIGFIAIHFHLPALLWAAGEPVLSGWIVWAWTIIGALAVNALRRTKIHKTLAGAWLAVGLAVTPLLPDWQGWSLAVALLFMLKVLYAFAVDHFGDEGTLS